LQETDVADADLGITGCDALVAATGSIVLTARSGGGRALSVLPSRHLVIARRGQLVPHLADALALVRARTAPAWPTMTTVITGPSRTADIEKVLVLGAHGPRELAVVLVEEPRVHGPGAAG
jgi:L-lactate dehydrogenase complex protein LldG